MHKVLKSYLYCNLYIAKHDRTPETKDPIHNFLWTSLLKRKHLNSKQS